MDVVPRGDLEGLDIGLDSAKDRGPCYGLDRTLERRRWPWLAEPMLCLTGGYLLFAFLESGMASQSA